MGAERPLPKPLRFARGRSVPEPPESHWKVLVVDDDEEVHAVTRLVLRGKVVLGRGIQVLCARSQREAREILREEKDIACVLLDVVMEENDSGLELARFIREELQDRRARIVLRTGQPGRAPEAKVIVEYEINDYKEKTELTDQRLLTAVVTAIRGYRDIMAIEEARAGMERIVGAAAGFFALRDEGAFAAAALRGLAALLGSGGDGPADCAALESGGVIRVVAGAAPPDAAAPWAGLLERALASGGPEREGDRLAIAARNRGGAGLALAVGPCPAPSETALRLLSLYRAILSEAFSSVAMRRELESACVDREMLTVEVHHRVRNNLQLVAGLINMSLHDAAASPERALRQAGARIQTMADVHKHLLSGPELERVDFADFLPSHVESMREDYIRAAPRASVRYEIDGFILPLTLAIPCGLVLSELVAAALDYESGRGDGVSLLVRLGRSEDGGACRCLVAEEGAPSREGPPIADPEGFAGYLVSLLVGQLKGRLRIGDGPALRVELEFPFAAGAAAAGGAAEPM